MELAKSAQNPMDGEMHGIFRYLRPINQRLSDICQGEKIKILLACRKKRNKWSAKLNSNPIDRYNRSIVQYYLGFKNFQDYCPCDKRQFHNYNADLENYV